MKTMNFGEALEHLKKGGLVSRTGWNGKGMYLALTSGSTIDNHAARSGAVLAAAQKRSGNIKINDHVDMVTADGSICCGWLASQADMLADDWMVV